MFADTVRTRASSSRGSIDWELITTAVLLGAVMMIGLVTAPHFGTTVDEFNADPYGRQALAWYLSGFSDDALFRNAEVIHLYGPWFQIITALVQSVASTDPLTVRHALTFVIGLLGIAALGPIARLTIGRGAGLVAIGLCLITGYVYGHLFFSPIDVPFLAAMTWATLAIIVMTRRAIPSWRSTVITGLALGLALGTRPGGVVAQAYLAGAMALSALEIIITSNQATVGAALGKLALRMGAAIGIAWLFAVAIWPWLQIGSPFTQFWNAFTFFNHMDLSFNFMHWGREISTAELPWHYILGQLAARLPEPFLALLLLSLALGMVQTVHFFADIRRRLATEGPTGLRSSLLPLARNRGVLVIAVAALAPILMIIALDSTIYDGIRHILFVIPMLALVASWSLVRLVPQPSKISIAVAAATGVYLCVSIATLVALHPLQYVAMNSFAGGTKGAYSRFELDYWSAAATVAIRRLEQRLDRNPIAQRPKVMVCIGWREPMVAPMFRRDWEVTTNQDEADFLIETERSSCAADTNSVLIDEVVRAGRSFARTYAIQGKA